MKENGGFVYLVGAGPGSAGLLTLRGKELLEACDVCVYDRLAGEELLQYVKSGCRKIYAGKQPGAHSRSQEEINGILVREAQEGRRVVRLKGGDPFVFGRGGEEAQALEEAGVGYEVVPGVTSAVAAPEACGIPVTHRGVSRSFHVITAHTADSEAWLGESFQALAALSGTLVFLMGMEKLEQIARGLTEAGKEPSVPAAVIQEGTAEGEKIVRGSLGDIARRAAEAGLRAPAVIVVGPAAALQFRGWKGTERKEASEGRDGEVRRIGICGSLDFTAKLKGELEGRNGGLPETEENQRQRKQAAAGGRAGTAGSRQRLSVLNLGFLRVKSLTDAPEFESFWRQMDRIGCLVFTSVHGVDAFFAAARQRKLDHRRLHGKKIAVIGPATGERLEQYGFQADLCPEQFYGKELGETVAAACRAEESVAAAAEGAPAPGGKEKRCGPPAAALLCSAGGGYTVGEALAEAGVPFLRVPVYDMAVDTELLETALRRAENADALVFGSSGAAEVFFEAMQGKEKAPPQDKPVYCIGEVTAGTVGRLLERAAEAADIRVPEACTVRSLADLICNDRGQEAVLRSGRRLCPDFGKGTG